MPGALQPSPDNNAHDGDDQQQLEILTGLRAVNRSINPKYLYDETGSKLFEAITSLPEYYPTRTETGLLEANSASIAEAIGPGGLLVEPGAGNCSKVRLLLDDLRPACYMPIDISADFLEAAAQQLQADFPAIDIYPVAADFTAGLQIPAYREDLKRTLFYPGSTIGNFTPEAAANFLVSARQLVGANGGLLIGVDLKKDPHILNQAYNDSQGVTAQFNLNILTHLNVLLGSNFDPAKFRHLAFYNEGQGRIEMHLESTERQEANLPDGPLQIAAGERIHTEYSYKYSLQEFADLAGSAGFTRAQYWVDADQLFSLQYFKPTRASA